MASYDPDRIAALAAGSLDPEEAAVFEAEVAADPRAAAELAAQRSALQAIRRSPTPTLSPAERSELHRAVAAALNLEPAAQAASARSTRRRLPWRSLAVAAAALAVIVGIVPVIGLLSVGGGEESATTLAAVAAPTTTLAATLQAPSADAAGEQALTGEASTTAAGTMLEAAPGARAADEAAKALDQLLAGPPVDLFAAVVEEPAPCAAAAFQFLGTSARPGPTLAVADSEGIVWFLSSDGSTVDRVALLETATCLVLASRP